MPWQRVEAGLGCSPVDQQVNGMVLDFEEFLIEAEDARACQYFDVGSQDSHWDAERELEGIFDELLAQEPPRGFLTPRGPPRRSPEPQCRRAAERAGEGLEWSEGQWKALQAFLPSFPKAPQGPAAQAPPACRGDGQLVPLRAEAKGGRVGRPMASSDVLQTWGWPVARPAQRTPSAPEAAPEDDSDGLVHD